jgi:hypothetical protein
MEVMIPKDKHDLDALELLAQASDEDVIKNANELLEWLQDINWPVFNGIVARLSPLGNKLELPITKILNGSDSIWKANIVGHLIPLFDKDSQQIYTNTLKELLNKFDENDLYEGVIDFVEIQLKNVSKNT